MKRRILTTRRELAWEILGDCLCMACIVVVLACVQLGCVGFMEHCQ